MTRRIWATTAITALTLALASLALAQDEEGQTEERAAPAPATGAEADASVEVTEISLGSELENGVPVSATTSFSRSDGRIYCVVRLRNGSGQEGAVRVAFERAEGEPQARAGGFRLDYPARPIYRTVARTSTQRDPGSYRCVVRTDEGQVLSHAEFTLSE